MALPMSRSKCLLLVAFLMFLFGQFTKLINAQSLRTMSNNTIGMYSVAFVTIPAKNQAKQLARGLVENKLAACINIIPGITSIYEWEGKIEEGEEQLMMIKTRTDKIEKLTEYVKKNHNYTVVEVISFPIANGNEAYLKWIGEVVPAEN